MTRKDLFLFFAPALMGVGTIAGCGSGNTGTRSTAITGTNGTTRATGNVTFTITWPSAASRVIPAIATAVRLRLTTYDVPFADGSYVREVTVPLGQQPGAISGVPVGMLKVEAFAVQFKNTKSEGTVAATGAQIVVVVEGDNTLSLSLNTANTFIGSAYRIPADGSAPTPISTVTNFTEQLDVVSGEIYELTILPAATSFFNGSIYKQVPLDIPNELVTIIGTGEHSSGLEYCELLDTQNNPLPDNRVSGVTKVRLRAFRGLYNIGQLYFIVQVPSAYISPQGTLDTFATYWVNVRFPIPNL